MHFFIVHHSRTVHWPYLKRHLLSILPCTSDTCKHRIERTMWCRLSWLASNSHQSEWSNLDYSELIQVMCRIETWLGVYTIYRSSEHLGVQVVMANSRWWWMTSWLITWLWWWTTDGAVSVGKMCWGGRLHGREKEDRWSSIVYIDDAGTRLLTQSNATWPLLCELELVLLLPVIVDLSQLPIDRYDAILLE